MLLRAGIFDAGKNDAERAFNVALEQNPNNPFPHRCLAQLNGKAKQDQVKATEHPKRAEALARA